MGWSLIIYQHIISATTVKDIPFQTPKAEHKDILPFLQDKNNTRSAHVFNKDWNQIDKVEF